MATGGNNTVFKLLCGISFLLLIVYWVPNVTARHPRLKGMIDAFVKGSYKLMDSVEFIKQDNLNTAAYEIGYVNFMIMEKYRRIVDKYNTSKMNEFSHYAMELLLYLEDIEHTYFEIDHLRGMLHEVERKYNITTPLDTVYEEPQGTSLLAQFASHHGVDDPSKANKGKGGAEKGKGTDKGQVSGAGGDDDEGSTEQQPPVTPTPYGRDQKKKKLKLYKYDIDKYIFYKMNPTTTPKPSPWPIEYGWEIDYHW